MNHSSRSAKKRSRWWLPFLLGILIGAGMLALILSMLWGTAAPPSKTPFTGNSTTTSPSKTPSTGNSTTVSPSKTSFTRNSTTPRSRVLLSVPALSQYPGYPTGCEILSTVMALHYMGESVSPDLLIDRYLATSSDWYTWEGVRYGPDPKEHFLGDPRSENSYGCFSPVIQDMLCSYLRQPERVVDAGGVSLPQLCAQYVDNGLPVILWASMEMRSLQNGASWVLPNGETFTWPGGEHCLLLVGYDKGSYYFNDPRAGACVAYDRTLSEQRYTEMGKQALVITP